MTVEIEKKRLESETALTDHLGGKEAWRPTHFS